MKCWINKTLKLNDSWGQGAVHTLTTPLNKQPEMSFRSRHLRDGQGALQVAHFAIDFPSGYLADGWRGVNLVPLGSAPVTDIKNLPAWSKADEQTYRKAIDNAASLSNPNTARLEGVVPYLSKAGGIAYNKVKFFYVEKAVQGKNPDLVVIKVSTHAASAGTVQGKQDGAGHGPPD
jgi:hypothetical protein